MSNLVKRGVIVEANPVTLLARVVDEDGNYLTQANTASISITVTDLDDTEATPTTPDVDVADVIYDTLQTDNRWTEDDTGYNVALPLTGANFPSGDHTYRVEVLITPVAGEPFRVLWEMQTVNVVSD